MAGFIQNMIWSSVEGFVDAAKKTGGEYAGNALIKAGDAIENSGRSVGGGNVPFSHCSHNLSFDRKHADLAPPAGIERVATGYGSKLSGQTYQASSASKALPSTARKPVVKRSNSLPANTKPSGALAGGRTIAAPTSSVPLGAKKTAGGAKKAAGGAAGTASRSVGGVTKTAGGAVGGVGRKANSSVGGVSKYGGDGLAGLTGGLVNNTAKGVGGIANGASKPLGGLGANAQKALPHATPKPYDSSSAGSSYTTPYPTAKKTAVRPGQSKPFTPPKQSKPLDASKPYPGTNTLPGQASKTPVRRTYQPAPRLGSQVQPGQKMTHIGAF